MERESGDENLKPMLCVCVVSCPGVRFMLQSKISPVFHLLLASNENSRHACTWKHPSFLNNGTNIASAQGVSAAPSCFSDLEIVPQICTRVEQGFGRLPSKFTRSAVGGGDR